jgi:hypothetical protein
MPRLPVQSGALVTFICQRGGGPQAQNSRGVGRAQTRHMRVSLTLGPPGTWEGGGVTGSKA